MAIYGNTIGVVPTTPKTYLLETEDGAQLTGVLVGEETIFDATPNDVREGKVYAGDSGVKTGEKVIPSYHSTAGQRKISVGCQLVLPPLKSLDRYDFTKLQAIICKFNTETDNSFESIMVVIDDGVYAVNSQERIATVTKDHDTKTIDFGISNETDAPYVIRFFTYKEII